MPMIIRNNIRYAGGSGGSNSSGSGENIVELTQAEYDALGDVVNSDNITYYITDSDEQLDASSVVFDDTKTQLGASDVQGAISKLNSNKANQNDVSNLNDTVNELNNNLGYGRIRLKWDDSTSYLRMAVDNTENVVNLKGHVTIPFSFGIDGDGNYGYYGADGSLVPFKRTRKIQELTKNISTPSTVVFEFNNLENVVGLNFYQKEPSEFARVETFSISGKKMTLKYANSVGTYNVTVKCRGVESNENLKTVTKTITVSCTGYGWGPGVLKFSELSEVVAIKSWSCSGAGSGLGDVGQIYCIGGNELFVLYDCRSYSAPHDETITITVVGKA